MLFYIACEFIALIFLIIYVGALMILFLFIIMLFNLQNLRYNVRKTKTITYYTIMGFTVGLSFMLATSTVKAIFLAGLSPRISAAHSSFPSVFFYSSITTSNTVFSTLYMQNNGCILFFLTILLLFALIAAITIASFKEYNFKKID